MNMETIAYSPQMGKTLSYLLAASIALGAAATARADDFVDFDGGNSNLTAAAFSNYAGMIITNGTITLTQSLGSVTAGRYTIGNGATLKYGANADLNGAWDLNIIDGGTIHQTKSSDGRLLMPQTSGDARLTLDNGTFITEDSGATSTSSGAESINFGMAWLNKSAVSGKNLSAKVILRNNSKLSLPNGMLLIGGARNGGSSTPNTLKVDFAVTNSIVESPNKQIQLGVSNSGWLQNPASSYTKAVFGPGSYITCSQIYAYANPSPSAIFDGATIHLTGSGDSSIIGHSTGVGDIYTIDLLGLTVDTGDKALTADDNASSLVGVGGITKIGEGSITWNKISASGSGAHVFTGPLVVSNGTWTSSLGYAASAFKVDGANSALVLSGALSAANVALAATDGGRLTLAGATLADASPDLALAGGGTTDYFTRDSAVGSYAFDTLTLGPGAVLDLDADATGSDAISATTTDVTATAANPVTINLNFTAAPAAGRTFAFVATDDAAKFAVNPKLGSLTVPHEMSIVDGVLVMTVTADDYVWNGSQTNWSDADAWTKGGAPATWSDGNNAIFSTANASVTLAADAAASKVAFNADATVSGSATLTASEVAVAADVAASISAPTAGALAKTGAGTLTLGSSRTDQTTLSEGTLAMESGATLDPSKLMLGTDAANPVTLDYSGQTLSGNPADYLGVGMDVTLTNGTFVHTGDVKLNDGNCPLSLTVAPDAVLSTSGRYWINTEGVTEINVIGGEFDMSSLSASKNVWLLDDSSGRLRINAADGALIRANGRIGTATGHTSAGRSPKVDWVMVDSKLFITGRGLYLGNRDGQGNNHYPVDPQCRFSMTNGVLSVETDIVLGNGANTSQPGGWYIAEFDNCIVTAKQCRVYGDRPASRIHFNGTTLVANGDGENWIAATGFAEGATPVTIGADGLVLDTNGKTMSVNARLGGTGGLTVKGGGRVTMTVSSAYSGVTKVEAGTTLVVPSLDGFTGGFETVAAGAALPDGVYQYIVIDGEGTLPDSVLSGLVAPDGCRFVRTGDGKTILCVSGNPTPTWIGGASGSLSVDGNWSTGYVPVGGACIIGNATEANLEKGGIFAAESITFPADSASVAISGDFTTLTAIVNESLVNMTFTGFVDFGDGDIDVTQSATYNDSNETISGGCVVFAGGVRGVDVVNHTIFTGEYTLAKTTKFNFRETGSGRYVLNTNATLNVKSTDRIEGLYIKDGATFHVENASHGWTSQSSAGVNRRLWCWNEGTFIADSYSLTDDGQMWLGGYIGTAASAGLNENAVLKVGTVNVAKNGQIWLHGYDNNGSSVQGDALTTYIGAGGLGIASGTTGYFGVENNKHASTIRPWNSDFTIGRGDNESYDFRLKGAAIDFSIHTTDEDGVARTVTLNGRFTTEEHTDTTITVKGTGTNVVNSASPLMVGTYAVADTATVVLNNGAGFANGTVSVGATATLAVGESGTASVGNLTLAAGAKLGFIFTDRQTVPVLALSEGGNVAFTGEDEPNISVKISGDVRPVGGLKVLTTGGGFGGTAVTLAAGAPEWAQGRLSVNADGNIVLDVKPMGTMVIVR